MSTESISTRLRGWGTKTLVAPLAAVAMLVTGGAAAAQAPSTTQLRVELSVDIDYVDPALSYYVPAWAIEYATCAKLVNYPDRPAPEGGRLQPEVARAMPTVSPDGKTYTFELRDDFVFSPPSNEQVTAAHFKWAIDRALNRQMSSPAQAFYGDIVGAQDVINGTTNSTSGVVAEGYTLRITLTRPAADFLPRLAMPFTCPLPLSTPVTPGGLTAPVPSAGPYYIQSWTKNQEIVVAENPNYDGDRPHHFDEIHYGIGLPLETIKLRIDAGDTDWGDIPPSAHSELAPLYGPGSPAALLGRQRWFPYPAPTVRYLAMNHDRSLFGDDPATGPGLDPRGNVKLKQAVNFVIDRTAMLLQHGDYAGVPTDQHLPYEMPGFRDADIYPFTPNVTRARELAGWQPGDPMRDGVFYCSNRAPAPAICQIVQANLQQIGLAMEIKLFPRAEQFTRTGMRGEPFDMTLEGWHMDYYDPYDFLFLLDGGLLRPTNNTNFAYFNDPVFNAKINGANGLYGEPRATAFGDLDIEIARDAAPWAAYGVPNDRYYFSDRVGCQTYSAAYTLNLAALCLRPAISIHDVSIVEGDSGTKAATFTVSLGEAAASDYPLTVSYATADGTAGPADYEPASGTVTFAVGETMKQVSIEILGDTTPEPAETFHVRLSSPSKGTVVRGQGTARILNDDGADTTPPTNPTSVTSPSHLVGPWTTDAAVETRWSGAADDAEVAGYSVEWSGAPATIPDGDIDLAATTLTEELDDGEWWFHVRAVDSAGNPAVGAAHLGPFAIDTTPPEDPFVDSESHQANEPSRDNTVDVFWEDARDDGSGVAGYSVEWTRNAGTLPDARIDTAEEELTSAPLADGSWWFHLRTIDEVGNSTGTVHLGPFVVDTTAPSGTMLFSPSHTAGTWTSNTTLLVRWSGSEDAGSGVAGYSFEFGADPGSVPDASVDAGAHVNGYVTGALSAPTVYFHLRVVDRAGNWSDALHAGPFLLDPHAPVNPTLRSTTHTPSRPSTVTRVATTWSSANDERSGVDGFSFEWSRVGSSEPDTTKDAEESVSGTSSPALGVGQWWFHLRTRDNAGNWSSAVHLGPFVIEQRRPTSRCVVPSVRGKTLRAARVAIRHGTCRMGRVQRRFSSRVKAGRVVSQRPRAGARLAANARVHLVVSKGKRR
jgi:peptide/nickel transport system substrate-binding protein